jgi:poly(glycerol-phosphate) alpha-glucosyltransferase
MRLGILTPSISNKAGGMFGAVVGQNKALYEYFSIKPQVFGLHDELSERDRAAWEPLSVTIFASKGPTTFGYSPDLAPALREANLDLLHVHGLWMYPAIASMRWARHMSRPYLTSIHGMLDPWAVKNSYWKKKLASLLYQNNHLRHAACLHALTESEARSIRASGLTNPICVIPLGIDIPENTNIFHSVAQEMKVLLYLGRLHPKKGLTNLIYAWKKLQGKNLSCAKEWILEIAGWDQDGYEQDLKTLCKELGIESSVRFIGARFGSDKESTYRSANAFILPSFSEGLPMVVLEAWAHKLPVLMTPQCNLPEGFQAGAANRIQTDVDGIVSGLEKLMLMSDPERECMGESGRKLVLNSFSWKTITGHIRSVYQWILSRDNKPDCVHTI